MLEDFADDIVLAGFDEGDDFHGAAALGAAQRIDLIDALDEHGPADFRFGSRDWRLRRRRLRS